MIGWSRDLPVPADLPFRRSGQSPIAGALQVSFDDLQAWHANHLRVVPGTLNIQHDVSSWIKAEMPFEDLRPLIKRICDWGGKQKRFVLPRVKKESDDILRKSFDSAQSFLVLGKPREALAAICCIQGFGYSFGSKHLRFLSPKICPVLDSVISKRLSYKPSIQGYVPFSEDCLKIAAKLSPLDNASWGAADIEMAIFSYLYHPWKPL